VQYADRFEVYVQHLFHRSPVAEVYGRVDTREESEARARLIAAAPDLYEALDGLLRVCSLHFEASGFPSAFHANAGSVDVARAALAKARGES
jgi:hypothetical protein